MRWHLEAQFVAGAACAALVALALVASATDHPLTALSLFMASFGIALGAFAEVRRLTPNG